MNFKKTLSFVVAASLLAASTLSFAGTVRVSFTVPYDLEAKVKQEFRSVSTKVEVPYKAGFFSSTPSSETLKTETDKINAEAKLLVWKEYLANETAKHVLQKTNVLDQRVEDLVNEIEIDHSFLTEQKLIQFMIRGKINQNLVSQIAGYLPSAEEVRKAKSTAIYAALDNYLTKVDSSKARKAKEKRSELRSRVSDFVSLSSIESEPVPESNSIRYFARASVNDNMFNEILFGDVAVSDTGEGSMFGFIVLPRIQDSVETFGLEINDRTISKEGTITENQTDDAMNASGNSDSVTAVERNKKTTVSSNNSSASTVRKSNKVTWRLADATPSDSQINKHFTENGYEMIEFNNIIDSCGGENMSADLVREDLLASKSGDLSRKVNKAMTRAIQECEIPLFGVGVINIDSVMRDRNSGGITANVVVNIKVQDYSKRLPRRVASVGPIRFKGIGATEEEAIDAALIDAASNASDQILAQLRTKKIK